MEEDHSKGFGRPVSGLLQDGVGEASGGLKTAALSVGTASTVDAPALALHAETVAVSKRVRKTRVSATRTTRSFDQLVEHDLLHESVVIDRVAVNRVVDAVPPIREEGDVTIVPLVEEVVVVQLVLKEEVHLRRVRTTQRHTETVALRKQDVAVTRTPLDDENLPTPTHEGKHP